jgi:hypothetical protein
MLVAIALAGSSVNAASNRGSIRGLVVDALGKPLVGAAVLVLADAEAEKPDKVVRQATTGADGKFTASNIAPGTYRVKAEADGFTPVELDAEVRPNKVTVFDSILLRRLSTVGDDALLNADSKYAARRVKGTIFHYDEPGKSSDKPADDATIALTDRTPELHASVFTFGQSTLASRAGQSSFVGANFAISEQIGKDINIVVAGQAGHGLGAPQSLRAITTANASDRHQVSVALGYGRFTLSRNDGTPRLGQFSISATDTWQVSGPVLIVYGLDFSRFAEGSSDASILPRFGVTFDAGAKTRLFAAMLPGATQDSQSRFNLESGEIEFTEPAPVAFEGDVPVIERSYRLQFGGERVLSDNSSVEVMAFLDTVSGHGVGLMQIPHENPGGTTLTSANMSGRTHGVRVVYHRRINKIINGSIGYAVGQGQRFDSRGLTDPASLFSNGLFQAVSARVDAAFVRTGTRFSTVMRVAPEEAVFAIDPFLGQSTIYDPNLSLSLIQELPNVSFMPGQWAAVVDLRNLFDQQGSVADERQELIASRYHRLIRVGLSLRF